MPKLNRPEEALQRQVVATLRMLLPSPWIVFHIANGGGRSKAEAGVLKAMGVLAGMPDLMLIGPGSSVLAIELKRPPMRLRSGALSKASPKLSPAQDALIAIMGHCGVPVIVATSLDTVLSQLRLLGVPLRGGIAP